MIVLFVNMHKQTEQGVLRFKKYYDSITKILKQTLYYGSNYQEMIRHHQNLDDLLFDELNFSQHINNQRAKEKFQSVTHVFIEGPLSVAPWSQNASKVLLLIRNSFRQKKKIFLSGFGHIAGYYYLTTKFDKKYCIKNIKEIHNRNGKEDYFYEEETGDLYINNKKICNSGVKISRDNKNCGSKSLQALKKGLILPTKSHCMAFGQRNGHSLLRNINFPFSYYQKSKIYCTPLNVSKAKAIVLVETQDKSPLVYIYQSSLSIHMLCPETLKIFALWVQSNQDVHKNDNIQYHKNSTNELGFDNYTNMLKATVTLENDFHLKSDTFVNKFHTITARPKTAMTNKTILTAKSKFLDFQKPSIRTSSPYTTQIEKYLAQEKMNRPKLLGRSRMIFKTDLEKNQIETYVQRTPSRPPSSHNFRDINKAKWMDKKTFFVT